MAKKRARTTSRLDSAAMAAGSALGSLAKKINSLTSQREAITTQLQRLVGQAEGALRGLASGENPFPFGARKAKKRAAPKKPAAPKKRTKTKT
mgnify:CR=1 FL=1